MEKGVAGAVLVWCVLCLSEGVRSELVLQPTTVFIGTESASAARQSQEKQTALFSCLEVQEDDSLQRPRMEVLWYKDGAVLDTSSRKYRVFGKKKLLQISDLADEDSGVYECAFSGSDTGKGRAELWIAPTIEYAPSPQHTHTPHNFTIMCRVSGGVRSVEWRVGGKLIANSTNSSQSTHTVLPDGSLHITGGVVEGGVYQCAVGNPAGTDSVDIIVIAGSGPGDSTTDGDEEEASVTDCVKLEDISFFTASQLSPSTPTPDTHEFLPHPPARGYTVPQFSPSNLHCAWTTVGYSIILPCAANGIPPPTISWEKDGHHLESSDGFQRYQQLPNGGLLINTVQIADKGDYTCYASNAIATVRSYVKLKVFGERTLCGMRGVAEGERRRRIAGGDTADSTHWPWQVLLEYPDLEEERGGETLCGGALIRPDWVLTAGHCLYSHPDWLAPSELSVRVGVFNRSALEPSQQQLEVDRIVTHPLFTYPVISNEFPEYDIALLHLKHPAQLNDAVGLVCLPLLLQDPPVGSLCSVTGWGHLHHRGSWSPDLLHQVDVPTVSYKACRSVQSYRNRVSRLFLCAGHEEGGGDACQNDSGGPLVYQEDGRWTVYGVVNYGEGCGKPHKYGLYARVTRYLRWIKATMEEE